MSRILIKPKFMLALVASLAVWAPAEALAKTKTVKLDCSQTCPNGSKCSCTGACSCDCDIFGNAECKNIT